MIGGSIMSNLGYISGNDYNDPDAPWNDTREEEVCEVCNGDGRWYLGEEGDTITEDEYNALPYAKRETYDKIICPNCDGEGYIVKTY